MGMILGIDVGTSMIKTAAIDEEGKILGFWQEPSRYDSAVVEKTVEHLLEKIGKSNAELVCIMVTGMGAGIIGDKLLGIPVEHVTEFEAMGCGGLKMCGINEGIICSVGTGTAIVCVDENGARHMGGSAVGGGTLVGLSRKLFHEDNMEKILELASKGDTLKVDISIKEAALVNMPTLPDYATSVNLGKTDADSSDADLAQGILNLICQTAGTMAVFIAREEKKDTIVMVGNMSGNPMSKFFFSQVEQLYGYRFLVPEEPAFATAYGAAVLGLK